MAIDTDTAGKQKSPFVFNQIERSWQRGTVFSGATPHEAETLHWSTT